MNKNSNDGQVSHVYRAMATVSFVLIALSLTTMINYLVSPEDYTFGSQTASFRYSSPLHFWALVVAQLLFSLLSYGVYLKKHWRLQTGFLLVALVILFL